jgi:predicted house-cleaning noncanonical NTP pyrophosphatase (MazG superfamily)
MKVYNKLIRDRIPEVIEANGKTCEYRVLRQEEFLRCLGEKLLEELKEYQASGDVEELADMVEVILAIVKEKGVSPVGFEQIRLDKREKRGGFEERLFLVSVD